MNHTVHTLQKRTRAHWETHPTTHSQPPTHSHQDRDRDRDCKRERDTDTDSDEGTQGTVRHAPIMTLSRASSKSDCTTNCAPRFAAISAAVLIMEKRSAPENPGVDAAISSLSMPVDTVHGVSGTGCDKQAGPRQYLDRRRSS